MKNYKGTHKKLNKYMYTEIKVPFYKYKNYNENDILYIYTHILRYTYATDWLVLQSIQLQQYA